MENITVRIPADQLDEIDDEAGERDVTRSEYIRETLATRKAKNARIAELEQELERARAERDDLRNQLREANRRDREMGELAEYVKEERALQRRERERREAPAWVRAKLWLFGDAGDEGKG
jgi:chromosome segregation ATPase